MQVIGVQRNGAPSSVPSASTTLLYIILKTPHRGMHYGHSHFTDGETEAAPAGSLSQVCVTLEPLLSQRPSLQSRNLGSGQNPRVPGCVA